ncbi:hypothetical protein SAMD00019534_086680 [Acytostelium subglobosum LB1]|uniref:hypothetical protein n=1 Tax=Acytostelium subglobosum LB1 TaxID=1410327 RepID=UPI000644F941|nr:hypothetical protein SAMD00019534_086680 [Acytostelium subglobosum LB1]GAM25493.1 hypothetical protein SAMD00019534_086680 [Acytostelium subglobosum LB1]|eukprot:XP_012751479.1 hypothetical protein SAMD00019534_086680 [Acytostelium subglobosum LB1]
MSKVSTSNDDVQDTAEFFNTNKTTENILRVFHEYMIQANNINNQTISSYCCAPSTEHSNTSMSSGITVES